MAPRFFFGLALATVISGCSSMSTSPKEVLARRYPAFIGKTTELYEVSLDFWEKMDQTAHKNEVRLLETYGPLALGDAEEARRKNSERMKILEEGYTRWSKIFSEIRGRMDANKDVLFYFAYHDAQEPSKSNQGVLIVRNGKIRDKIILNGEGAWKGE